MLIARKYMAIPDYIKLKEGSLPPRPGVYFMQDMDGKIMYVGKATSLRTRVSSYFIRPADDRIAAMVQKIRQIDWEETPTAIEALILEAKYIKKLQPPYNQRAKDDKSWIFLAFTRDDYPRPVLVREYELAHISKRQFLKIFGPYKSAGSVQAALDALRQAFPWSVCLPGRGRPCFYAQLGQCPGVCTGTISPRDYRVIIRGLLRYFDGQGGAVVRSLKRNMKAAAAREDFSLAAKYRDRLWALKHIRDIAILKRDDVKPSQFIDTFGRIEGYDISNLAGQQAVGSMVVFEDGRPRRDHYRKFKIKTVAGPNDTAMIEEVLRRRLAHLKTGQTTTKEKKWPRPDLILVDGGRGQLNVVRRVLKEHNLAIPAVGLAKGFDRKQDELVYDKFDHELARLAQAFKPLLQQVRDEAHRFAVAYHRKLRKKR